MRILDYKNQNKKKRKGNQKTVFNIMNKALQTNKIVIPNINNFDKDMVHCYNNFFLSIYI